MKALRLTNAKVNITIRPWQLTDLNDIRVLALQTWLFTYDSFISRKNIIDYHDNHYSLATLTKKYNQFSGLVGLTEEKLRAYSIADTCDRQRHYHIISLYVDPDYQGKGLGKALLKEHVSLAQEKGYAELWLGVMEKNTTAYEWYLREGFTFKTTENFQVGSETVKLLVGSVPIRSGLKSMV